MLRVLCASVVSLTALAAASQAHAALITFEDQPAGPSVFSSAGSAQTLTYSFGSLTAQFTGGVILTNETGSADTTNVYATSFFGDVSLTNPLTITFSQPVTNFQIDVTNGYAGSYVLSDNAGHSNSFSLASTGSSTATEGLAAAGTVVHVAYTGSDSWDFAIDNISFDVPTTRVPEPASLALLSAGLIGWSLRRRKAA